MSRGLLYLMYHELELPGRKVLETEPGYLRYVVHANEFREQLAWLRFSGFKGLSVGEALLPENVSDRAIVITFDDGASTDLTVAAPILREFGFSATFYITSGFLGRPGFLNQTQVRELARDGFEIGCHSRTHRYLNDLDESDLEQEIVQAKKELESIVEASVDHYSCPGGRWSQAAVEVAKRAGFKSCATSQVGRNSPRTDPYRLARVAILRGDSLASFKNLCAGTGLLTRQSRAYVLQGLKSILGNYIYEKWRSSALPGGK